MDNAQCSEKFLSASLLVTEKIKQKECIRLKQHD